MIDCICGRRFKSEVGFLNHLKEMKFKAMSRKSGKSAHARKLVTEI